MALICPNGHRNDEGNRFCDQCGAPLPAVGAASGAVVATSGTAGAAATSIACPVCGQENVPGTAFCDNCGAALPPPQPVASDAANVTGVGAATGSDAASSTSVTADAGATVTCSQCGTVNDATNRFCDNCGATLDQAAATAGTGTSAAMPNDQAMTVVQQSDAAAAASGDMSASTVLPTEGTTMPTLTESAATSAPSPDTTAPTASVPPDAGSGTPTAGASPDADRQRLEETIATQRRVVEQLEQMQQQFGAATPAAILQGLDEARANLARSEAELAALPTARPAVDPAEVARLEETIAMHRRMVEQLEQMQQQFGAATPAAVLQGLDEARANLARSEGELEALTGSAPSQGGSGVLGTVAKVAAAATVAAAAAAAVRSATATPESEAAPSTPAATAGTPTAPTYDASSVPAGPSQSVPATASVSPPPQAAPVTADVSATSPSVTSPPTPPATSAPQRVGTDQLPPPPVQPQVSGPRFLTRDFKHISLPRGGGEIVVGREDPISGIHPEVDLTPFGGEAGGVSRRHAVLREQNGQWSLTDLDSTNYTRIDGNRIPPNTPTPLHDGARVQFGRVELEFRAS